MYEIIFYKNKNDKDEITDYLLELDKKAHTSKEAKQKLKKILEYIGKLKTYGTKIGEPATKHLDGDIWELRPLRDRVLYAYWKDKTFVLLHHFQKKTNKTPPRELTKAKSNLKDWIERNGK